MSLFWITASTEVVAHGLGRLLLDEVEPDEVAVFCPECWSREFSDA